MPLCPSDGFQEVAAVSSGGKKGLRACLLNRQGHFCFGNSFASGIFSFPDLCQGKQADKVAFLCTVSLSCLLRSTLRHETEPIRGNSSNSNDFSSVIILKSTPQPSSLLKAASLHFPKTFAKARESTRGRHEWKLDRNRPGEGRESCECYFSFFVWRFHSNCSACRR